MRYVIYGILCLTTCFESGWTQPILPTFSYPSAGYVYTQQFDSLPNSGIFTLNNKGPFAFSSAPFNINKLMGWQFMMTVGSNSTANFLISTGSSTGNGLYSFGNTGNTDRALGSLSSSSGSYSFGLLLTNNTGRLLNKYSINFTAEQWRKGGSTNKNFWTFSYATGNINNIQQSVLIAEPLGNFNSVINTSSGGSLDGNLLINQQMISFSVSNIDWKNGEQLLLRWDDTDESGSDDGVGIDNFSFNAQLESSKPAIDNIFSSNITTNTAILNGTIHENNASTNVVFEYDTLNNFTNPISVNAIPENMNAGTGIVNASSSIIGLQSGITYYFRIKASNINGTTISSTASFTTTIQTIDLVTATAVKTTNTSAIVGGNMSISTGAFISEKGIVWAFHPNPTIADNKISMGIGFGSFSETVTGLPSGTLIYVKAYVNVANKITYGNTQSFTTKTLLVYIQTQSTVKINDSSVLFEIKYLQNITGLSTSNFELCNNGVIGASIKSITGSANLYSLIVNTGTGDGTICLLQNNSIGLVPEIENLPFTSTICYTVDKSSPQIIGIEIPNKIMIIDDTIPISIYVTPDKDIYKMNDGSINDFPLFNLTKINDSTYTAFFTIINNGNDVFASDNLVAKISLKDAIGNNSLLMEHFIIQSKGQIDANKPFIKSITVPAGGLYKTGDSLNFIFHFSEKLNITASANPATFSLTIGTKVKTALYHKTDSLDDVKFTYIIQPGDFDKDGIKLGSSILLKETIVKDLAGNLALWGFNNTPSTKNILIDAISATVSSVTTPTAGIYKTGQKMDFIVNYSKKVKINEVFGYPTLTIVIGTKEKKVSYKTGSGSTALVFNYTIEKDDFDKDGIKLISPINVNDAKLTDELGNTASLNLSNIGALSKITINPVTAKVLNVSFPLKGSYKKDDTLKFNVNFSENIFVSTNTGKPSLKINIGNLSKNANYLEGSGTNTLLFVYIVQPGESDTNGIKISSVISLNNGFIKDSLGNDVPVSLNNIASGSAIFIDAVSPSIKNVSVPDKNIYKENDTLNFLVNFSEKVILKQKTDTPYITIHIGSQSNKLYYCNGSEKDVWLFQYIVHKGELDKNGIRLDSFIVVGQSDIIDFAGNQSSLTFKNIGPQSFVKIDAVALVFFSEKPSSLVTCENNSELLISDSLSVIDEEVGEQINWQVIIKPQHGVISKNIFQTYSTGKLIIPNRIFYYPDIHYHGVDSMIVQVSDNVHTSQKMIRFQMNPLITNNIIGPSQLNCMNNIPDTIFGSKPIGGDEHFQINWEMSTFSDTSNFITLNNKNQFDFYSSNPQLQTSWIRRKVRSGECADFSNISQIKVIKNGIWTGTINNDWQNKNNWCNSEVPDISTDVYIKENTPYAPIIYDSAICHHLTILNNTTIRVKGTLQIKGMIHHSINQIDAINGTLLFSGKETQTIPENVFKNETISRLIIDNVMSVNIAGKVIITKMLQLVKGTLITNNHLQLAHTAVLGPCATGTSISDTVSIGKLISAGKKGFRFLGNPFSHDLSFKNIKDSIDITGFEGNKNGFTNSMDNLPSLFKHDPIIGNDSLGIEAGWIAFSNINNQTDNLWKQQSGIKLLYRGSLGQGLENIQAGNGKNGTYYPNASILNLTGKITTGDKEIKLVNGPYAGYHVVANPYPSNINLSLINAGRNIGLHFWIWNPYQGKMGGYSSIPFTNKYILETFGAFIVKSTANNNNQLLFTENCKVLDYPADSLPKITEDNAYHIEIRLESDSIFWDRIILLAIDSAKNNYDKLDAEKFSNPDVNFYTISRDQKRLSIDARPVNNESSIPLGIQSNEMGSFYIRIAKSELPKNNSLQLHDKFLDKWMKLEENNRYPFIITVDTSSSGNNRFEITSPKKPVLPRNNESKLTVSATPIPTNDQILVKFQSPERAYTQIRIINLYGISMKSLALGLQKEGQIIISVMDLPKGIYILELVCGNRVSTQKMIKQ